jgi:NCS1 family nucleobase:cation symporter-1
VVVGIGISLAIYNPLSGDIHCEVLFYLTPTGCSFIGTGILYWLLNKIPAIQKYTLRDKEEMTYEKD